MKSMKHQQGVTAVGWLIILGLIAFFVSLALKLFPVYIENYNIVTSLKSMEQTDGLSRQSISRIKTLLQTKLDINDVKSIDRRDLQVRKREGKVFIDIEYSVTVPFAGAISIVADFHEKAVSKN